MSNTALNSFTKRRTQYSLGKQLPISQADAGALIQEAIRQAPSAFNSQSSRAVILFGAQSVKFWELVKDALRPMVPAESFGATEKKLDSFAAGAGTVLFYEDQDVVKGLQQQFAAYADNFPIWSEHSTGIAQFAVWTALAEAGIGASLQHYNPVVMTLHRRSGTSPLPGSCVRRCRSAPTKPPSATSPSWTMHSVSACMPDR